MTLNQPQNDRRENVAPTPDQLRQRPSTNEMAKRHIEETETGLKDVAGSLIQEMQEEAGRGWKMINESFGMGTRDRLQNLGFQNPAFQQPKIIRMVNSAGTFAITIDMSAVRSSDVSPRFPLEVQSLPERADAPAVQIDTVENLTKYLRERQAVPAAIPPATQTPRPRVMQQMQVPGEPRTISQPNVPYLSGTPMIPQPNVPYMSGLPIIPQPNDIPGSTPHGVEPVEPSTPSAAEIVRVSLGNTHGDAMRYAREKVQQYGDFVRGAQREQAARSFGQRLLRGLSGRRQDQLITQEGQKALASAEAALAALGRIDPSRVTDVDAARTQIESLVKGIHTPDYTAMIRA